MSRKILLFLIALSIIALAAVIFSDDTIFVNKKNIVLVGYSKYSQEWIDIKEGALSAGQKKGINITAVACDSIHAVSDQIQLIEQAIDEKADAIIIMPTDMDELADTIEKVIHSNIDLILIDNYQQNEDFLIPRVGTNIYELSQNLAQNVAISMDDEIDIGCIFSYDDNGKSLEIYSEFLKQIEKYDNVNIVAESVTAIDENVASAATEVMLNTYDVDYIVCFEETITKGTSEYLSKQVENEESELSQKTKVIGIGSIDECARFLEDEIIRLLGIQSYYNMGYLSVQYYADTLRSDVYSAHYIIRKEDLFNDRYQKILFRIR